MTRKQAKKQFGCEGSYRLRKKWQKGLHRGKTVNPGVDNDTPKFSPSKVRLTREQRINLKINNRISKALI